MPLRLLIDILNRPALLLGALAAAAAVGALLGRTRGALLGLLLVGSAFLWLLAVRAARFGLPDATGPFLLGAVGAIACLGAVAWLLRPKPV